MIINEDSLVALAELEDDSVDAVITDPPYGYSFMSKDWDKAVPSVDIWKECLRVLKPGGWCMVMSAPRSDVQNAMISRLMEAGFRLDFTPIYWTYASGFPKAGNVGKLVDKRNGRSVDPAVKSYLNERRAELGLSLARINQLLGTATNGGGVASAIMGDKTFNELPTLEMYKQLKVILHLDDRFDELIEREEAEREVLATKKRTPASHSDTSHEYGFGEKTDGVFNITAAATDQAKALDGSYTGFQPKPAVEVIIVAMKPLSEKTYVDQALKNGKGITWLEDARIPYGSKSDMATRENTHREVNIVDGKVFGGGSYSQPVEAGRFPANLLVQDDVLNDGVERISKYGTQKADGKEYMGKNNAQSSNKYTGDSGSYSRYFDLDKWAQAHLPEQQMKTFPFAIFPKASKSEKNKGLAHLETRDAGASMNSRCATCGKQKLDHDVSRCKCEVHIPAEMKSREGMKNHHPTVKPLKLMSYLITLTTREGDTVLDPFVGSGTTVVAAKQLNRKGIGIEREPEYADIAQARVDATEYKPEIEQTSLV